MNQTSENLLIVLTIFAWIAAIGILVLGIYFLFKIGLPASARYLGRLRGEFKDGAETKEAERLHATIKAMKEFEEKK